MCARATVVTGFPTGVNPVGTEIPIFSGDVRHDASADVRATLELNTDPALWPDTPTDLLNPYGTEVFVERGVVKGSGAREWVSQGYYRIDTVEQDDAPDGDVRVTGKDRMAGLVDARLESPVQFTAATTVADVFSQLVLEVYPTATIEYDWSAASTLLSGNRIADEERYGFLADLVKALGKTFYWDYRGVLVVKDPPVSTVPVWNITHGLNGVLVALGRERTREGVYNAVVASGEAPGATTAAAYAVARDRSPSSPTRWGGPFGKVPRFYSSPLIVTNDQAASAATQLLKRAVGLPHSVNFAAIANPALEPLDPVYVSYSDQMKSAIHVLDELTIPLTADQAMTAKTRDLTDIDVEVIP